MNRGDQVAHIPAHANGNRRHPDVEFGFVTSFLERSCYCRFWVKDSPGTLRTVANSELVSNMYLIRYDSVEQCVVDRLLSEMYPLWA